VLFIALDVSTRAVEGAVLECTIVVEDVAAAVTEVGTLLLEAVPTAPITPDERWKSELNVRADAEDRP
jgi:hypothetical protein